MISAFSGQHPFPLPSTKITISAETLSRKRSFQSSGHQCAQSTRDSELVPTKKCISSTARYSGEQLLSKASLQRPDSASFVMFCWSGTVVDRRCGCTRRRAVDLMCLPVVVRKPDMQIVVSAQLWISHTITVFFQNRTCVFRFLLLSHYRRLFVFRRF